MNETKSATPAAVPATTPAPKLSDRDEFLSNCIITAVEGAIGYWSEVDKYHHTPGPARVRVHELDEPKKPFVPVDIKRIDKAIQKIIASVDGKSVKIHSTYVAKIAGAYATNDESSEVDAEIADIIMQVAVLGEVIYG